MLDRLSDDEVSRQILGVFGYRRAAYFSAMIFSTYATAISSAVRDGDFQRELNKAVANNWITIDLRNRYRYQLTATGLCREADDRPGTWPSDEFRKTIEVGLSH